MTIAYLLQWTPTPTCGVTQKIHRQIAAWTRLGHSVHLFLITPADTPLRQEYFPVDPNVFRFTTITRLYAWRRATHAIVATRPHIVYSRYYLLLPGVLQMARRCPFILEVNSDDLAEYPLFRRSTAWYNRLTRGILLRCAAGLIFVTAELADKPHFARFQKPRAVIPNGIALGQFAVLPPPNTATHRLAFLGSPGHPWHGVDLILDLAKAMPDCHFDLIGINGGTFDTLPRNVEVHSSLNRLDYERLLSRADAGIGSLALHRLGLTEACPLKTREYLAYGLPVIIGYKDSDFPSGAPFVLQLDTRHGVRPTHVEAVYSFLHHWKGRRVTRDMVHHLDIAHKEIQRIAFFEGVAGSWGKPRVS